MTKQTKNPGMGLYFLAIILLLLAYYAFAGGDRTPTVTYAQVEDLFQREQVTSFYVRDGSQLYLNLQDGTTVTNTLGSVESFREELGDLIRQQKADGILTDYNYDPVYSPPWWSQMLIYVLLIGGVFLLWQYMAARAQGGGGMDQGRRFSKANREADTSRPYPSERWCSCASPNPAQCPPDQSGGSVGWHPAAAGHGRTLSGSCRWCWRAGPFP